MQDGILQKGCKGSDFIQENLVLKKCNETKDITDMIQITCILISIFTPSLPDLVEKDQLVIFY